MKSGDKFIVTRLIKNGNKEFKKGELLEFIKVSGDWNIFKDKEGCLLATKGTANMLKSEESV